MQHGGNIDLIESKYKIKKEDIIDLSANTNPVGMPKFNFDINILEHYPDENYKSLRYAIAKYTNTNYKNIIVTNGSSELISLLIKIIDAKETLICSPTYSEYERQSKIIDSSIKYYVANDENNFCIDPLQLIKSISTKTNLLVLCNPNNPTGKFIEINSLDKIISHCEKTRTFVMIDEAYAEFFNKSAVSLTGKYQNLIIIRALSKFFCMPGLRLGYGITSNESLLKKINKIKDAWSVNSLANEVAKTIFMDNDYINKTKSCIKDEYIFIKNNLSSCKNFKLYDTSANFFMCKILTNHSADQLFDHLLQKHILIRSLSNLRFLNNKFFRFAIGSHENNSLLISQIKNFFDE